MLVSGRRGGSPLEGRISDRFLGGRRAVDVFETDLADALIRPMVRLSRIAGTAIAQPPEEERKSDDTLSDF
jgi:hypothetical protein